MITIKLRDDNGTCAPLWAKLPNQVNPQHCYLEWDPAAPGELEAYYCAEVGNALPASIWHGIRLRWLIPAATSAQSLRDLADDGTLAALLGKLEDSHSIEWNGSNYVGRYPEHLVDAVSQHLDRTIETAIVHSGSDALACYTRDDLARMVERDSVDGALAAINEHDPLEIALVDPITADDLANELADNDIAEEYPGVIRALVAYGVMSKDWIEE